MTSDFAKILAEAQKNWMDIDGVVSVAQGKLNKLDCIDVYIIYNTSEIKKKIPKEFKNYPVVFRESGGPFKPHK